MLDYFGQETSALKNKKLFLFDMDGTIYLGNRLFEGVIELLASIRARGGRYVFISNNSSRSVSDYVKKLQNLGICADTENFFTSTQAACMLLRERFNKSLLYVQGTRSFVEELKKEGLNVTEEYSEQASGILVGFDPEITGKKMETTCRMLMRNLPYYATNPDWVCPTEFGAIPDCGSMCQGYERATGKTPIFIGKPQPTMIEAVMQRFGVDKQETLVIGDRLYTDIASGQNAGVDTLCVLSGEVTLDEVQASARKPSYTLDGVWQLLKIITK